MIPHGRAAGIIQLLIGFVGQYNTGIIIVDGEKVIGCSIINEVQIMNSIERCLPFANRSMTLSMSNSKSR